MEDTLRVLQSYLRVLSYSECIENWDKDGDNQISHFNCNFIGSECIENWDKDGDGES